MSLRFRISLLAVAAMVTILPIAALAAEQETVLYAFHGLDGKAPVNIIRDSTGTIYGSTTTGGPPGTIFRLVPASGGGWTQTTLHAFAGQPDGSFPQWGIVEDSAGNLFGATESGGTSNNGSVFELSPDGAGGFTYQVIYSFTGGADGASPLGIAIGPDGSLYGDAQLGGIPVCTEGFEGCGTMFQLSPPAVSGDPWVETTIYTFTGASDGFLPQAPTFDTAGNLYGFATFGGNTSSSFCFNNTGCGAVFRLSRSGAGWQFDVLFRFQQSTGANPDNSAPAFDAAGNLYGVTGIGGRSCPQFSQGCGTAFKLSPTASGPWSFSLLHTFTGASDGAFPSGAVALDAAGNVFGVAEQGGSRNCSQGTSTGCGTVYELSPVAGGGWQFVRLWAFPGIGGAGFFPARGPILDPSGNLLGTTSGGGNSRNAACQATGCGLVYELSPATSAKR